MLLVLKVATGETLHLPVVASGSLVPSLRFHSLLSAELPTNISHNLARKYFWTCSGNNTVNGERLEYC